MYGHDNNNSNNNNSHGNEHANDRRRPRQCAAVPALEPIEEKDVEFSPSPYPHPLAANDVGVNYDAYFAAKNAYTYPDTLCSQDSLHKDVLRDKYGFALFPQPLDDPKDPLTWKMSVKLRILIQVSLHSFLSHFSAFAISPAVWPLSRYLHTNLIETSYLVGAYVILLGVAPFVWNPLSHSFGRRPLLIVGLAGSVASSVGCGFSKTYVTMMVFRSLNGLFGGAAIGLGSVIICDVFYQHQRGLFMGIYMVVHMTGGHLAPTLGGFIFKGISWKWTFWVPAIAAGALLALFACGVPETLYSRSVECLNRPRMSEYQKQRVKKRRRDSRKVRLANFTRQIKMLRYPSVSIPALFYAVASGYGNTIFIVSSAILFRRVYRFHTYQVGLLLGAPLTLGSLIGEAGAGGFSDWVVRKRAERRDGKQVAEDRLFAMLPGVFLLPLGLVVEAYALHERAHWMLAGLAIAVASAGLQIVTTVTYTYTADCYSRQVAEIGSLLNFGRQVFAFGLGFYAIPFAHRFGVQLAWGAFAGIEVLCFVPVVLLMWKGQQWRESLLPPDWNLDL